MVIEESGRRARMEFTSDEGRYIPLPGDLAKPLEHDGIRLNQPDR
jgi:hypothetical protein